MTWPCLAKGSSLGLITNYNSPNPLPLHGRGGPCRENDPPPPLPHGDRNAAVRGPITALPSASVFGHVSMWILTCFLPSTLPMSISTTERRTWLPGPLSGNHRPAHLWDPPEWLWLCWSGSELEREQISRNWNRHGDFYQIRHPWRRCF